MITAPAKITALDIEKAAILNEKRKLLAALEELKVIRKELKQAKKEDNFSQHLEN